MSNPRQLNHFRALELPPLSPKDKPESSRNLESFFSMRLCWFPIGTTTHATSFLPVTEVCMHGLEWEKETAPDDPLLCRALNSKIYFLILQIVGLPECWVQASIDSIIHQIGPPTRSAPTTGFKCTCRCMCRIAHPCVITVPCISTECLCRTIKEFPVFFYLSLKCFCLLLLFQLCLLPEQPCWHRDTSYQNCNPPLC